MSRIAAYRSVEPLGATTRRATRFTANRPTYRRNLRHGGFCPPDPLWHSVAYLLVRYTPRIARC